jgi:hypothetical protein
MMVEIIEWATANVEFESAVKCYEFNLRFTSLIKSASNCAKDLNQC